ncbi:MAG: hypothetical protein R3E53_21355 [Myxococcota bacterium]
MRLASGREIGGRRDRDGDGLELLEVPGGVRSLVDGKPVDFAETWSCWKA